MAHNWQLKRFFEALAHADGYEPGVIMPKTCLENEAGYMGLFLDTEGIRLQSRWASKPMITPWK